MDLKRRCLRNAKNTMNSFINTSTYIGFSIFFNFFLKFFFMELFTYTYYIAGGGAFAFPESRFLRLGGSVFSVLVFMPFVLHVLRLSTHFTLLVTNLLPFNPCRIQHLIFFVPCCYHGASFYYTLHNTRTITRTILRNKLSNQLTTIYTKSVYLSEGKALLTTI